MKEIINRFIECVEAQDFEGLRQLIKLHLNDFDRMLSDGEYSLLHHLCESGWIEGLEIALGTEEIKAGLNAFDNFSWTPLILAIRGASFPMVERLINAGADVNASDSDRGGNSPIAEAVDVGCVTIVRALLERGADPTITGWMGLSAIHRARRRANSIGKGDNLAILKLVEKYA